MNNALDDAIARYAAHFGASYPIFMLPAFSTEEAIEFIEKCIRENRPALYYFPPDKDAVY